MVGAYAAVGFASSNAPKALWSTNPVTITFSGSAGTASSGSVGETVKCAPKVDNVVFHTTVKNPTSWASRSAQGAKLHAAPPRMLLLWQPTVLWPRRTVRGPTRAPWRYSRDTGLFRPA